MKRMFCILTATVILALFMTGCGCSDQGKIGNGNNGTYSDNNNTENATANKENGNNNTNGTNDNTNDNTNNGNTSQISDKKYLKLYK